MRLIVVLYFFSSIAIAFSAGFNAGWSAALCTLGTGFLSLLAGGGLKYALWWGDKTEKIGCSIIAILLAALAQWMAHGFSVQLFGYYLSGGQWGWIGFAVCFVCTDKKLAGITTEQKQEKNAETESRQAQRDDDSEAVKQYRKAAEQGNAEAQYNLGIEYADIDPIEAARWLDKAAKQGHIEAQHDLGYAYRNGDGLPKNYVLAYKWFSIAAINPMRVLFTPSLDELMGELEKVMSAKEITEARKMTVQINSSLKNSSLESENLTPEQEKRKKLLMQRKRALQMLEHPDAPQELRNLAKGVYDKTEAILSLQDAQARKAARERKDNP